MWFENKKTGVKFDVTEAYAKKYFSKNPDIKECADPKKPKPGRKPKEDK